MTPKKTSKNINNITKVYISTIISTNDYIQRWFKQINETLFKSIMKQYNYFDVQVIWNFIMENHNILSIIIIFKCNQNVTQHVSHHSKSWFFG
jgi:hypothetical protein